MREHYPEDLTYFRAFTARPPGEKHDPKLGERRGERHAFSGVIEPNMEPMTQAQYDRFVRKHLAHYKRIPRIIRIETIPFVRYPVGRARGPHTIFERGNGRRR